MRASVTSLAVALSLLTGAVLWTGSGPADDDFYAMRKNFELFGSVYQELVGSYVTRVDPERFMRTGMDAMIGTLDPWTDFLDEADNVDIHLRSRRLLGDVGLNLGRRGGRITVLVPDESASAYRQGMRTGDVILRVGGQSVDSLSVPDVLGLLRGEPGSVVDVQAERDGRQVLLFRLRREAPAARSVSLAERLPEPDNGIVYLKLDRFGPGASAELATAIGEAREAGPVSGIVLDLRDNPGGLLAQAVAVGQLFLPKGTLVTSTRGRAPEANRAYHTNAEPVAADLPLAVLINGYSASASELVAGALQDHDRAVILGSPSFGKGLVQVYRQLPYNTSLKVTTARYYTPSGRGIRRDALENPAAGAGTTFTTASGRPIREGFGVEPEIRIDEGERGPLEQALDRQAAFFQYAGILAADDGDALRARLAGGGSILPDGVMDRFESWIEGQDIGFTTPLEQALADVPVGDRDDRVGRAWRDLVRAAREDRDGAFEREHARLETRLREELLGRLLGPSDRARRLLVGDPVMESARSVLHDAGRRDALLSPR